jgi:hypothetical protein
MNLFAAGGPAWLLAICASRVGAGAWGWAFLSLGIAGVGAVVSVVLLHRTPAAAALHGPVARPAAAGAR